MQSSEWYKKIPLEHPNSNYINKSISYFLNSLMIIGEIDSAKFYTNKFKKNIHQ